MSYCSITDLRAAIGEKMLLAVADRDNDDNVDTTVVSMAISYADAVINSRIASRYSVPLASTVPSAPTSIRMISLDIAKYRLLVGMPQPTEYASNLKSAWSEERQEALKQLSMYATGVMVIPGVTPVGVKPVHSVGLAGNDVEKTFTMSRNTVGGGAIDTGEAGSMDVW